MEDRPGWIEDEPIGSVPLYIKAFDEEDEEEWEEEEWDEDDDWEDDDDEDDDDDLDDDDLEEEDWEEWEEGDEEMSGKRPPRPQWD
jgi:hypothetical protein